MKVKELIAELQQLNPDTPVILQKDAEGNGYSPLRGVDKALYMPDNTWQGEVYSLDDPDRDDRAFPCVVLHPIN
jgi:hypothetical protein